MAGTGGGVFVCRVWGWLSNWVGGELPLECSLSIREAHCCIAAALRRFKGQCCAVLAIAAAGRLHHMKPGVACPRRRGKKPCGCTP